jgi:hypothetical protein
MIGLEIGPNLLAAILALVSLGGTVVALYRQQTLVNRLETHTGSLIMTVDRVRRLEQTADKTNGKVSG